MRKLVLFTTAIVVLLLTAACGAGNDVDSTAEPTEDNSTQPATPTLEAPPVETPTDEPAAYPVVPTPTAPGMDGAYPIFTPEPTRDPYPGGLVVILHPAGVQCEEPALPDLSAAIGSLEEAGITVLAAEEVTLNVCEACTCPTSEHYRIQISPKDLDKAYELGWYRG